MSIILTYRELQDGFDWSISRISHYIISFSKQYNIQRVNNNNNNNYKYLRLQIP